MNKSAVALSLNTSKEKVVWLSIPFSAFTKAPAISESAVTFSTGFAFPNCFWIRATCPSINLSSAVTIYLTISFLASRSNSKLGTKPISYSKTNSSASQSKFSFSLARGVPKRFNLSDCTKRSKAKSTTFFTSSCLIALPYCFSTRSLGTCPFLKPFTVAKGIFSFILFATCPL